MRHFTTHALSLALACALMGQAGATSDEGMHLSSVAAASAVATGADPFVPASLEAIAAPTEPTSNRPPAAATIAPPKPSATRVATLGPSTARVATLASAIVRAATLAPLAAPGPSLVDVAPASTLGDVLMWTTTAPHRRAHAAGPSAPHATHSIRRLTAGIIDRTRTLVARITQSAMRFVGTPYSFGGTTAAGFDCSGYVQHIFALVGVSLPRTADAQYLVGERVDVSRARRGDLVFFQTYAPGASHVGIYLGDDRFIHSSSSQGVTVSSLRQGYWAARYVGIRRVLGGARAAGGLRVVGAGASRRVAD